METKICTKCGKEKPLEAFSRNKKGKFGRRSHCKACVKAYQAEHREERAAYLEEHKEERAAYREEHKEEIATRVKIYNEEHKEERATYRKEHAAEINAHSAKRHAKKLRATPAWADADKILAFYKEAQRLTEETGVLHHVDHIYPLQGETSCGLHVESNLQVITEAENCSKHNRLPEDFYTEEELDKKAMANKSSLQKPAQKGQVLEFN